MGVRGRGAAGPLPSPQHVETNGFEMVTTANEVRENEITETLAVDTRTTREAPAKLAMELERCDREMAAAMKALLTGSVPIIDALLWYTDWCRERELILLASDETDRLDVTDLRPLELRPGGCGNGS